MPCSSAHMEPTPGELKQTETLRKELQTFADELSLANDFLREYLLGELPVQATLPFLNKTADDTYQRLRKRNEKLYVRVSEENFCKANQLCCDYEELNELATRMEPPTKKKLESIRKAQVAHREEDLDRLLKVFAAQGNRKLLKEVLDADPSKPLNSQLSFSPNDY